MSIKFSVIVPAYNEGKDIVSVLDRLKTILQTTGESFEIIVVNDGSTDDTAQGAHSCDVKVIEHKEKLGYGRSLKDGIYAASGEFILIIDADGTYDIDKIPEMFRQMKNADLVVGKRIFAQKSKDRFKNIMRRFFAYLVSYYAVKKIEDLNSGQRIFRKNDIIGKMDKFPNGFSFTSTMTVQYLLDEKRIIYVPITYTHRSKESKFVSFPNICTITKLAFALTLKARPLMLLLQLGAIFIVSVFLSRFMGSMLNIGFFAYLILFVLSFLVSFLVFLCYIYARGKTVFQPTA